MGKYSDWLKNREVGEENKPSPYTTNNYAKYRAEKSFGLDTFESDLQSMGGTINDIYNGWQTQETMNNTRSSVEEMQKRIDAYQKYQSKYGGADLSEVASGYQSVLDNWDTLTSTYGYYQNADAFNTAKQKYQFDEQFRVETEDGYRGLTYDEVIAKTGEYKEGSDEYNYLTGYLGYTDLKDFDKALEDLEYTIINAEGSEKEKLLAYQNQLQEARNRHALDNKFDLYKGYMDAEDFEEKSQYNSTQADKWYEALTSQYGMGYKDIAYEYINNVDGIRDEIKSKAQTYGRDTGNTISSMEKKGYDKLNEEEISVYNYIYKTEGKEKAQEFLDEMELTLTKRVYDEATQRWENVADNSVVASVAMSAFSVPANIVGGVTGALDTVSDAIEGKEYNPYGYYKMPSNFASDTRQYVGENIAESTEGMELFGQNVPSFLYQTGMSTADSAVGALTLKTAFSPIMGSTAFQQKAKELKEAGASEEEIMRGAIASGTFEMMFEYFSIDKLLKIKNADTWGKFVTQAFKQAGIEASEEMATEFANIIWDDINRGDSSELKQMYEDYLARGYSEEEAKRKVRDYGLSQIGWAGVGGALSGGAMGGTYSGSQYFDNKSTGSQIQSNNRVDDMWELSANSPQYSDLYKLYESYAEKGINPDNISEAQLGNLYSTAITEADAISRSKKSTDAQKLGAGITLEGISKVNTVKESKVASTGKTATIEGIKKVDGNTVLVTNEGDVEKKDMNLSYHDAELLSYVENMSEEKANLFISQYDGKSDLESYANSFEMAYAYGEDGFDADTVLNNKGVLTEVQASEIYKTAISNKVTAQQKAIDDINAKYGKTVTVAGTFNDSIIDYNSATTDDSKVNWNSLTSRQRDAIAFARGFSKATGVNITFIKSDVVNGRRVGKNGSYNHATNTIEIDVYAGIDADATTESIIPTLSHEMTHWMKAKAPAMYNKMKNHIMETLVMGSTETTEVIVNREMNKIQDRHPDMKVTREYAMDELVARACEDMLSNSDKARKMLSQLSKKEQKSFIAKTKETLKNLMEWVNELLAKYKSNSQEAKVLRQYRDRMKQLSKMWDKALEEAIQTNQSLQAEGITGEQAVRKASETQWADRVEEEFNIDATIEQTDGLIAVHNLSEDKLLKTLKLGAFPMPSIAVTKASIGHKGFGSISLLFNKETIDPRFFRSNKVYSGDAWTPTYPSISYKVNEKVADKVRDKYYELAKQVGYDELRPLYRYVGTDNLEDSINRDGGESAMLERLYEDTGIMQIYLQDTGKGKVEPIEVETRTEISKEEAEANQSFVDAIDKDILDKFEIPSGAPMSYRKEFMEKYKAEIEEAYRKVLVGHYELTEEEAQEELNATKPVKMLSIVRSAHMYTKNNGVSVRVETDTEATKKAIREASADGYKEWVDSLFKGVEEKAGIRNDKDLFTPSGKRRSWDVLHYEETLENVIKAMKEDGEKGIGMGSGNIFGASTVEFGSVKEIKEAGKNLRSVSQEEFSELKQGFMDRFFELAHSLPKSSSFMALDDASNMLVEAVIKYSTKSGIANYIKRESQGWANYSEQVVDDLIELVNDIRNMPINYFEAKPMRAVGFDEVACAVIPDNASEKVREELSKLNIPMKEYKAGDEDARVDVVNSVEGVQFSDRDSDGAKLSSEQIDFFKDSKIRDNNGNLKVMYHGSGASFTVFDKKKAKSSGYYGSGFYFTESSSHAQQYGSNYKVYLNITNPMQEGAKSITKSQLKKFVQEVADNEDYGIENYGYGATVDSVTNSIYGKDDFAMITDINATCIGDMVEAILLFNEVNGTTYDGIIVPTETVAFYPNQIKNVDNLNPTENEDIRYSDREIVGESGKSYGMGVYLDSSLLTGLNEDERKQMVKLFVTTELAGNHFTAYDSSNNAIDVMIAGKNASIVNKNKKKVQVIGELYKKNNNLHVKQEAVVLADEMIANAKYDSSKAPDYSHGWLDNYGQNDWEYWKVHIQEKNGTVWEAILNIANSVNGEKILYDIDPIKKVEGAVKSASNSTNDSINQNIESSQVQNSERDNVSVYDLMGQNKELQKQNAKLEEDVSRLKERLKLEKQVTKGNTFNANQLRAVAKHLRNSAGSTYNEDALVGELKEVYSYIVETPQLDWTDLMAKCYEVARNVLNESKGYKVTNDYFKSVLDDIRKARITLSDEQIQEAKSAYGARYRDAFMGRVMLTKNGTSLDQKWQEWSAMYPDIFDENVTGGDQITALSDIYDSLREGAEMYEMYNDAESIRAFALEVYNQYWNVSTIRTTADKYDKQIKRLNFEHRKAMNEMRSDYKKRVEDQKLADSIHYGKMLNDIRRRRAEEVKQAKESGKKRMADYKDRVAKNAKIEKITKNALTLNEWLTKNSKDAHIPEVMKAPVAYLLNAIDFSSKQLLGMRGGIRANTPTQKDMSLSKALEQVHDMVQKINSAQIGEDEITEIYGTFADFPAGFADDIRDLSSKVNDVMRTVGDNAYVLNAMTLEELENLDKIITIIKATVTKMNKFLAIRHAEGVANMSQQSINYMDRLGKAKERGKIGSKIEKMLDWGNALPYYTFKRFGEGGQKVYEALQDGWDKFAFHIKDIIDYAESTYTEKEVKEWEAMVREFEILEPATDEARADQNYEPKYQKIKMTVPQIMSLYCLQKREQAKGHLMGGGMRIADFEVGKLNVKVGKANVKIGSNTVSQTEGVVLSENDIDTIIGTLTDRQKAVADALQSFMNTTCADWGNEVSMLRFGFKAFGEENYFPIQSDKNNLAVNDETEQNNSLFRLLNMSFTKGTIKQANNRIVVSDIFDVFSQHTSDMAKYNSLALPVIDAFKWYNYKEKINVGETQFNTKSLKQSLENAFGKEAQNYIVTFLRDINGEQSAGRDVVGKGFFTNAKLASVGFNMRVVALQPTSYVRATALIDPKYLTKAFIHKPKTNMAQKHCGIALWKSLGFYDINVQNNVTDLIKHNQTARDKVVEASMKGAEIADKITWGYLWNACELEVRDKQKNLKVGSDEFYSAVANRLREIIYTTQVVDSTMTRSHMMRSRDGWDKMATAFMSEPTLSYNMLQDCYMDWKLTERETGSKQKAFKKCGKKMARVFTAYTVTNLVSALVESGFDILRDDEDDITPEEFIELYMKNFLSNMNILNNIPYVRDIVSALQGFTSSRTDIQWMQYLSYTNTGFIKLLEGEGNAYTTAKNALRAFSYATGLPFYNIWRDSTAVLDETELLTSEELEEMFNDTIGDIFPSLKEEKED